MQNAYNALSTTHRRTALNISLLAILTFSLTACGKSDVEICIDKQSHLWDNSTNSAKANKTYWDAVAKCKADAK